MTAKKKEPIKEKWIGNIFLCRVSDTIIKVNGETPTHVMGYDIATETWCVAPKQYMMEVTPAILKLIGSERARVVIAIASSKTLVAAGKLMGVTDRTIYRMKNTYIENVSLKS